MYSSKDSPPATSVLPPATSVGFRNPSEVRYIKLGKGGAWSTEAIADSVIPFGFRQITHEPCNSSDWATVRDQLVAAGRTGSGVTQGLRELRDFYNLGNDCLWVTFADGHLWWAFADPQVVPMPDANGDGPHRYRRTIDGWHRHSLKGEPLSVRSLSSALTRVAGYRMTICTIEQEEYLLRRILGEEEPLLLEARQLQSSLEGITQRMIAQLDWRDFEILVDLIFARNGWQRQSALGDGEVDIDLMLNNPSTGESAWVQIKSRASQAVLDDYLDRFRRDGSCDRFYFVVHSAPARLALPEDRHIHLWAGAELARNVLAAGLFDWIIDRTR